MNTLSLIKENEGLIYKIASKYKDYYNIEDLYQAGCIGIIKASNNYKEGSNSKFSTYAYKYILGEIIDFIRKDKNIILSDDMYNIYKQYLKVKELLNNKYNREVSFSEICLFMNIDERYMLNIIESVSISKDIEEKESYIKSDDELNIDDIITLNSGIELLSEEEKMLINYRYYQGYTQMETADLMGMSQVKVSRCEKLILSKMKKSFL